MAEWVRSLNNSALNNSIAGVGSSPARATRETSHVLLASVSDGFPGVLPFRPTYRLVRLDKREIILNGALNNKMFTSRNWFMLGFTCGSA